MPSYFIFKHLLPVSKTWERQVDSLRKGIKTIKVNNGKGNRSIWGSIKEHIRGPGGLVLSQDLKFCTPLSVTCWNYFCFAKLRPTLYFRKLREMSAKQ